LTLDGKSLRRTFEKAEGKAALHMLNAWACASRLCIGSTALKPGENEIVAIPRLLGLLDLKASTVTLDADLPRDRRTI